MSRNLLARIAVAAITIPIILWICYQGGWWLFGMLLLFTTIAIFEYLHNEGYRLHHLIFWLTLFVVLLIYTSLTGLLLKGLQSVKSLLGGSSITTALFILLLYFLLTSMSFAVGSVSPRELFERQSRLLWGTVYLGFTYPIVFLVGNGVGDFSGGDILLFLFGLLWVSDTAAMGIGKWLGRHKLAPTVSPNKTVEGFIGGIIGALAIGVLMHFWKFPEVGIGHILLIALGCSVFGQLGDLVESMWKRSLDIKDSSAIIPGHGGVLDRFDSLLFAAPFMYVYLSLLK
jgi:phosphatidate cytidylyltransferase